MLPFFLQAGTCTYGQLEYKLDGYTLTANYPQDPADCVHPSVKIGDLEYSVIQWHYHLGTEHSIDDIFTSADVHIVHGLVSDNADAEPLAVVGFGVIVGTALGQTEPTIDKMINGFVKEELRVYEECGLPVPRIFWAGEDAPDVIADPYSELPADPNFFQYMGGLTTPPCTEAVMWNYLSDPINVSVAEKDTINRLILDYVDPYTCEVGASTTSFAQQSRHATHTPQ